MTKQEYLDLLRKSCHDGTFPATAPNNGCFYRTSDGRKCAVGLLIPDELYKPEMEGDIEDALRLLPPGVNIFPDGMTLDDLYDCQHVHDTLARAWDADEAVKRFEALPCFAGCK